MQFEGHFRGVEPRPRPHGTAPDGAEELAGLRSYNPGMAGQGREEPLGSGQMAGPQILHHKGAFSRERQLS